MKKAKILIVEDEAIIAMELEDRLTRMGHQVVGIAADSKTALQKAKEYSPRIVLMDIHIKGPKNGIETAAELQSRFGIRVIYLTAHSDESTLQQAAFTKPHGYLLKPIRERELSAAIEMTLYKLEAVTQ